MIKDQILDYANFHELLKDESLRIIYQIKSNIREISDAQLIQSLIEKNDYYWKHELSLIKGFANKYQISILKLNEIYNKYIQIENILLTEFKKLEKLGLSSIVLGPRSINANLKNNLHLSIEIYITKQKLCIIIEPQNYGEEISNLDYVNNLRQKIEQFLNN
ncbi:hypothetical protein HOK68_03960 [Candidatus Woesearchaeota archaeon]|jgi:hypothetical protein|nr:hypothetical protein [Candidatus Woesearchaeota archaeon]MBT4387024.1 hypothetical protein [Candidatus Woesearchaeota archaeon]MBT4595926.1 hypothetical protein [Candidatus Woesearchaeota archaeon]MBT5741056.1 hypothetical protein [Candidatus Woesearchaeota archaeon]MBT6505904.1 hypothetical protein [Candidatus Woesearchaeota archaeon]